MADLDDQWLSGVAVYKSVKSALSWATILSQTRISTVDGLGLSESSDSSSIHSLAGVLQTVEKLKLRRYAFDRIEELREIAQGETFKVLQCQFDGKLIAVKHIRLEDASTENGKNAFQKRLHSVLREISIMHHSPLAHHPNIIDLYGYGWRLQERRPAPYIVLEFGDQGSLRNYLLNTKSLSLKSKLIFAGDVACGLIALHQCGIIHGDVKLDNVIVFPSLNRPSGCIAKICDFGHSLLLDSESETQLKYFGTTLYNAPEVALQKTAPIPREQLHKCDIWAYGLLAWEILAGGSVFFQKAWRLDSAYARPREDSLLRLTTDELSTTNANSTKDIDPTIDTEEEGVLGRFDTKHVRVLAKQHVNELKGDLDTGFAKSFLKPLFERTLQEDPKERLSDLARLPIVGMWNKSPSANSIHSRLAMYAGASTLTYDIFRREQQYIMWAHQVQLLQDFETLYSRNRGHEEKSSAAFQTAMCYLNSFGTSCDHTKATQYLRRAEEEGHDVAKLLNPQILGAIARLPTQGFTYIAALKAEIKRGRGYDRSKQIYLFRGSSPEGTFFANYAQLKQYAIAAPRTKGMEDWVLAPASSSVRLNVLETAIAYDDPELTRIALEFAKITLLSSNSWDESALTQAARHGNSTIMDMLLSENGFLGTAPDPADTRAYVVFCFTTNNTDLAVRTLNSFISQSPQNLERPTELLVHPQWPIRIWGTPLAVAVATGHLALVQGLLRLGADPLTLAFGPDEPKFATWTPLHLAVCYHFPEMVRAFVDQLGPRAKSALLDSKFPLGCAFSYSSPVQRYTLHSAACSNRMTDTLSCLPTRALLLTSPQGKTPLSQAIDFGDVEVVKLLLLKYPKLASKAISQPNDEQIFTYPLHYAAKIGSEANNEEGLQVVQHIWQVAPSFINVHDSSGARPIHMAVSGISTKISEFLMMQGANIYDCDINGQTPLHLCRFAANASFLLSSKANPNALDLKGFSPVHLAARNAHIEPLAELLRSGADLSSAVNTIGTPLHCAVAAKSRTIMSMILEAKADINARNGLGFTPLHLAIQHGRADLAILLLEAGADPFTRTVSGLSPLMAAINPASLVVLRKILYLQIDRGIDVHWQPILHASAKLGDPDLLKEVLHHYGKHADPDIDLVDALGQTSLHLAASFSHTDAVGMILKRGANVHAKDRGGNTPLLWACQSKLGIDGNSTRTPTCQILVQSGADIMVENFGRENTLSCAHYWQDFALMTYLIKEAAHNSLDISPRDAADRKLYHEDTIRIAAKPVLSYFRNAPISVKALKIACEKHEYEFLMTGIAYNVIRLQKDHYLEPFRECSHRKFDLAGGEINQLIRIAKRGDAVLFAWVLSGGKTERWNTGSMNQVWSRVDPRPLPPAEYHALPSRNASTKGFHHGPMSWIKDPPASVGMLAPDRRPHHSRSSSLLERSVSKSEASISEASKSNGSPRRSRIPNWMMGPLREPSPPRPPVPKQQCEKQIRQSRITSWMLRSLNPDKVYVQRHDLYDRNCIHSKDSTKKYQNIREDIQKWKDGTSPVSALQSTVLEENASLPHWSNFSIEDDRQIALQLSLGEDENGPGSPLQSTVQENAPSSEDPRDFTIEEDMALAMQLSLQERSRQVLGLRFPKLRAKSLEEDSRNLETSRFPWLHPQNDIEQTDIA